MYRTIMARRLDGNELKIAVWGFRVQIETHSSDMKKFYGILIWTDKVFESSQNVAFNPYLRLDFRFDSANNSAL